MIMARFDRVVSLAHRGEDQTDFARHLLPAVPNVGEIVNLRGDPYLVLERNWAVEDRELVSPQLYAYVRVLSATGAEGPAVLEGGNRDHEPLR
jgi:hypothetical protein